MKLCPKKSKKLNLLLVFGVLIFYSSCSKDKDNLPTGTEDGEIILSPTTKDIIVYALVDNIQIPIYLSIPQNCNNTDYPAIVLLHGSNGMWKDYDVKSGIMSRQNNEWREIFDANCIVGAYVDSYSARGVTARTGDLRIPPDNFKISAQFVRPKDANAALELLRKLKFNTGNSVVRAQDIGLLGFSDGATALAGTLYNSNSTPTDWEWTQKSDGLEYNSLDGVLTPQALPSNGGFSGGVFYYGGTVGYGYWGDNPCSDDAITDNIYEPYTPILFQIPLNDDLTENTLCTVELLQSKGHSIELNLYNANHSFDHTDDVQGPLARTSTINWFKNILNMN